MKQKYSILVITYGIFKLSESNTLLSLSKVNKNKSIDDIDVFVWNNKTNYPKNNLDNLNLNIVNSKENKSLSIVYNWFIQKDYDKFLILDQDSFVNEQFIQQFSNEYDLTLPKIIINGKQIYPKKYSNLFYPYCSRVLFEKSSKKIISIGSGIMISKTLKFKILKFHKNVFDERFNFYGVDSSFFLRLNKLPNISIKIDSEILHDLSFSNKNINLFKRVEKSKSVKSKLIYYPSLTNLMVFIYALTLGSLKKKYDFESCVALHLS